MAVKFTATALSQSSGLAEFAGESVFTPALFTSHVQLAELALDLFEQLHPAVTIRDVMLDRMNGRAFLEKRERIREPLLVAVADDDVHARVRERARDTETDAVRRCGDVCSFAGYVLSTVRAAKRWAPAAVQRGRRAARLRAAHSAQAPGLHRGPAGLRRLRRQRSIPKICDDRRRAAQPNVTMKTVVASWPCARSLCGWLDARPVHPSLREPGQTRRSNGSALRERAFKGGSVCSQRRKSTERSWFHTQPVGCARPGEEAGERERIRREASGAGV